MAVTLEPRADSTAIARPCETVLDVRRGREHPDLQLRIEHDDIGNILGKLGLASRAQLAVWWIGHAGHDVAGKEAWNLGSNSEVVRREPISK